MHHRWEVFRGDSTSSSDLLFTAKKSSIIQLRTELDVFLASNSAEQACDFKIKGSYFERSCAFYLGSSNTMIAQVSTKKKERKNWFCVLMIMHVLESCKCLLADDVLAVWRWMQMNRKFTVSNVLLGKDTFGVTVFPHVDYVFVAALVVILDEIHRERSD